MGNQVFTHQKEKGKCTLEMRKQMSTRAGIRMGTAHGTEKEATWQMDQCHELGVGYSKRKFPLIALFTQGPLSNAIMPFVCRVR